MLPPFQRLIDTTKDDVWRLCRVLCRDPDVEDCFQETFLAALRAYPRLREASNLRGWILQIAYTKAMDSHRARRRSPIPSGRLPETAAADRNGYDPTLWEAVRKLPAKQREAVAYRYVADLTYRDIASVVGGSEEAARQNVRAGLRKLRELWTDD